MKKVENKATWADRNEQISFSKKVTDLLSKEFGRITSSKYQGSGKIATLVIEGHGVNPKKIENMRKMLINKYGIKLHKINGHSHVAGTIVVHIFEISETSKKKIEDDFMKLIISPAASKQVAEKTLSKQIKSVPNNEESVEVILSENTETTDSETNEKNDTSMEKFSIIKKGRALISTFLTVMFRFEGIIVSDKKDKIFSFNEKKNDDLQIISFKNEVQADMGFQALSWYYGELAKEGTEKDGNDVWVNFFSLDVIKKRPIYINFTFSPIKGESLDQIGRRIKHVMTGYTPMTLEIADEHSFNLAYSRPVTTSKFFELIVEMGWDAKLENDVINCKFRLPSNEDNKEKKVLGNNFVSPSEKPLPELQGDSIGFVEFKPLSVKDLFTQAEAIAKFKLLYSDEYRWKKTSAEKQEKIVGILRKDLKESETAVFAKYLLTSKSLTHPLFTREEAVEEFKLMMSLPDFKQLPEEIQSGILTALKDTLNDDDIIDDLLGLF